MKKLITLTTALLIAVILLAQSPEKMNFQAVVRDNNNNLITNTLVGIRISIIQKSTPVYVETQTPLSNSNGLITIAFGGGAGFNTIDWANGPFFIKSEIDPKGGRNYTITGTSQLMSVPYAFHAQTASYLTGENNLKLKGGELGVGSQTWSQFGNAKSDPLKDKLGTTDLADMIFVTNNTERLRVKSDGKINTTNSFDIGDDLTVKKNVYLNMTGGGTTNNGTLTVGGITDLNADLNVKNGKPTTLSGTLTVIGTTSMTGKASMAGGADFGGAVEFKDNVTIKKVLTVDGATDIKGKATMVAADFSGQVTINANVAGGQGSYEAYPLRVQGSEQGIAIKVIGGRANKNNYVTFSDANGVQGRIEGESEAEMEANPEYNSQKALYIENVTFGTLDVISSTWEYGQALADLAAACSSTTGCAGLGAVVCAPIPSLIVAAATNVVLQLANFVASGYQLGRNIGELASYKETKRKYLGVTYQSGAGDYAEWLLKDEPAKDFLSGEIIGVKAGKISLSTAEADHILVVSTNPIVLGNMPEVGKESNYEKIAFMGQVPVKVNGIVNSGDYIIADGNNDGSGIAVSPANMLIGDYQKIVGIAWSANIAGYANVAVGLNSNDMAGKLTEQAREITDLKAIFNQVVGVLKNFDPKLATALDNIKTDPIPPGNGDDKVRTIKYFKPKKDQMEEAIVMAEAKLRNDKVDVDNHPFFKDMKDADKKAKFLDDIDLAFDKEVEEKTIYNTNRGIKTEKE